MGGKYHPPNASELITHVQSVHTHYSIACICLCLKRSDKGWVHNIDKYFIINFWNLLCCVGFKTTNCQRSCSTFSPMWHKIQEKNWNLQLRSLRKLDQLQNVLIVADYSKWNKLIKALGLKIKKKNFHKREWINSSSCLKFTNVLKSCFYPQKTTATKWIIKFIFIILDLHLPNKLVI